MKNLIKTLIRLLFPRKHREFIYWLGDSRAMLKPIPNEVNLVYWVLRQHPTSRVMVDVGAHFGTTLKRFAEDGWQVYAFEPDPQNRARLEDFARVFHNVTIDTRAVSNEIKTDQPFYRSEVSSGISGLSSFHPSHQEAEKVSTVTLEQYCLDEHIDAIDFLKVDTEGYDLLVLKSIPWDRFKPRFIICEFEDRKTVPLGYSFHDMAKYLMDHGYRVLVSEWFPVVEYGGDHRWRTFAEYPTDLLGGEQACGNLIAAIDQREFKKLNKVCRRYQFMANLRGNLR
jgi:FkbM family methyltransferase